MSDLRQTSGEDKQIKKQQTQQKNQMSSACFDIRKRGKTNKNHTKIEEEKMAHHNLFFLYVNLCDVDPSHVVQSDLAWIRIIPSIATRSERRRLFCY